MDNLTVIAGLPSAYTRKTLPYVLENMRVMPSVHSVYQVQGPKRRGIERGQVLKECFQGLTFNCFSLEMARERWLIH